MKAARYTRYGPPEVVQIVDVEKTLPKSDEVLIKVRAASVNPYDWHFMRGDPYPIRIPAGGLSGPKDPRLGADAAGQVEAVGKSVTQFKVGDEVFGCCKGAFAEYACAAPARLALRSENVTAEQAAAIPIAALTALQALRDKANVQSGQRVLVNGAGGGVGTFGVQLAKTFGAIVTGVCSTRNVEMVGSIGAERVIDYTQQDFTKEPERYDVILDCVGNRTLSEFRRVLQRRGVYVGAGGSSDKWMLGPMTHMVKQLLLSSFGGRKFSGILANINNADLVFVGDLVNARKVTPVIDRRYPLAEIREAISYLEEGHARGKVIITISQ